MTTREYEAEGEFVPGSPGQPYYYGIDQIGSVRRAFASVSSALAYSYDPYGNALQATAPVTDFNYAKLVVNADSGLYLAQFRAFDPNAGRWLSRDPMGEGSDQGGNLYTYVQGNPVSLIDPDGTLYVGPSPPAPGLPSVFGPPIPPEGSGGAPGSANCPDGPVLPPPANGGAQSGTQSPSGGFQLIATPNTGAPNSWYVNPGSGQMRFFGPEGYPALDIDSDHSHPGVGSPHMHIWLPNPLGFPTRQAPVPLPSPF